MRAVAEAGMAQPDGELVPGFDPHDIVRLVSEKLAPCGSALRSVKRPASLALIVMAKCTMSVQSSR
jgi:hypothetical protein